LVNGLVNTFQTLSRIARSVSFPFLHLRLGCLPKHWCPYFSTYLIKVTVDIYGHLAPEGNKAAVDRLDDDAIIRNPAATETEKGSAAVS
jgi:hypothetical protein